MEVPAMPGRALVITLALAAGSAAAEETAVRTFLRDAIGLRPGQVADVEAGRVVTRSLPGADKPEMAAFGAVRVAADKQVFLQRLRDLPRFRQGPSTLQIGQFHVPPTLDDLAGLTLEEGDFTAARECRPGDCAIKMARSALERVHREMDWKAADARPRATRLMKQMLVEYLSAYLEGGTAEMATYADREQPQDTPAEFRKVLAASPYLVQYAPELHRYLERYPHGTLEGVEDLFYWTKDKFGPKPTIAIHHVTVWRDPKDASRAAVATKQIYASHYFQAGLELTALVDAPAPLGGFYLIALYRARVDPPTGMLSGVLLGRIRSGVEQGVAEGLRAAKARAEAR
ncbi:MAG TPA: hypothetical protein VMR21_16910 [Vicinamibacteria bacterium]|nr:hypothetical protein [Vicinamibacteria bacterium]